MKTALALGSCAVMAMSAAAAQMTLETDTLRLTLSGDGQAASLVNKQNGKEYAVAYPLASARKGKVRTMARKLSMAGDVIHVTFGSFGISAQIAVERHPRYLAFELRSVEGDPEEITFLQLRTAAPERLTWGGILWFEDFCLGIVEREPETRVGYSGGKAGWLSATACADPGIGSHCVALYGCARGDVRAVVGEIEKTFGIPVGVQAKSNEPNRRSYVMGAARAEDVDQLIEYARRGGFGSILMTIGSWASYGQKYRVPERYWPGGLPQLKAAVDKIHAAGMLAGAHMFASKVPKRGEYTSPIPDPRIYKDHFTELAQGIDAKADRIVTKEPPMGWPRLPGTRDIHLDEELITYTELSLDKPYGFVGCRRGVYGTQAAAHKPGARMGRPVTDESRGIFIIDQKTSLLDEVAGNIARTYDGAGFDWMYFDGAEDVPPPRWYTTTMAQLGVIRRVKRKPVIVQNAASGAFCWHFVTRRGQRDYFWISMSSKDEVDDAISRTAPIRDGLLAAEIGWFPWRNPTHRDPRTQIDEFEYVYTKALAADVAVSVQATAERMEAHPQRDAILQIIGTLEKLRIENYFPESVKERVRTPHTDFMLLKDDAGKYRLQRAREAPYVAGTSRDVRAMIADPIGKNTTMSIWNVLGKCYLDVALLPEKCTFTDYEGNPLEVQTLPGSIVHIPVTNRLYMKTTMSRGAVRMAFRRAKVTPILPAMIVAQAEDANKVVGRFATGKKLGIGFAQTIGDIVVPTHGFVMVKPEERDYLEFAVDVPKEGSWRLWAHVRYEDTNSNSFYLAAPANAAEPERFGNDYNFGFWHWDGGTRLKLPKGPFTFRLYSREAKAKVSPALDMVLLVDDQAYEPTVSDVRKAMKQTE